jgi:predicted tellurium resistance membrane protein TerC
MKRLSPLVAFATITTVASSAWACPPSEGPAGAVFFAVIAAFLAIPYAAFTSMVVLSQSSEWFATRRWRRWFLTSVGGAVVAWVGASLGIGLTSLIDPIVSNGAVAATLIFSTPLVGQVAFLMWRHTRRDQVGFDSGN